VTNNSVQSLVARESLLRKMHFNPIVIPLAVTVTALLNLAMTFIAVLIFVFASGVYPGWGWLELPLLILMVMLFAVGVGMLLAALYVRYRDIQPIWEVVGQALFYASSVLFVVWKIEPKYQHPLLANPMAAAFTEMYHAVINPSAPGLFDLAGWGAAVPIVVTLVTFTLGLWYFMRESPRVAENL
jgi:ABC-2 type transport system permease protein